MNLLITGSSGFIGSNLIDQIHSKCNLVKAISKKRKLKKKYENVLEHNLDLQEIGRNHLEDIDIVIHLACAGVSPQKVSFKELIEVNVSSTLKFLMNSSKYGVRRFIAVGSCHEYGLSAKNYEKVPVSSPLYPITSYAASKCAAFYLMKDFCKKNNMEFFYGRIFNTYGYGQFKDNLFPSILNAIDNDKDLILKNPQIVRDFVSVEEVGRLITKAVFSKKIIKNKAFIANLGSGNGVSIEGFAKKWWSKFNAKGELILQPNLSSKELIPSIIADISELNKL